MKDGVREDIRTILQESMNAPSGSNSQPWKFRVRVGEIEVIAMPEKDHPILNFRNRGTWVAHGALLENILIAASAHGYRARCRAFPTPQRPNVTAVVSLTKGDPARNPLYDALPRRASNRKPYATEPLTTAEKESLLGAAADVGGGEVRLAEGPTALQSIGRALSVNEIVTLESETLHKLFVREVVWREKEERERGSGLLLRTMELAPPQRFMLKTFLRHWPVMRALNHIGAARGIAKGNAKTYAAAAAMGAIIIEDKDEAFLSAGRMMERIWLQVTTMGLSMQLFAGITFLAQRARSGSFPEIPQELVRLASNAYGELASAFGAGGTRTIAIVFRIGRGNPPSAISPKRPPVILEE